MVDGASEKDMNVASPMKGLYLVKSEMKDWDSQPF